MKSEEEIHISVRRWREHPAQMVRELFGVEPDAWQAEVLEDFPHCPLQALLACKGPGKTTVMAWLCWNFLLTREDAKIGATSISGSNLSANLWAEMAKWRRVSLLLTATFEWTAHRIFSKESPETWFMDFRTWKQSADEHSLGNTLAGLWADNVMNVIDEAGGVPVPILRTAEVVASKFGTPGCDGHVLIAGNTTSVSGALYDAAKNRPHMWKVYPVTADPDDPKRTPRVDIEYARQQIAEYGRENPWVMINILAQFPRQGVNTFISPEEVTQAQKQHYPDSLFAASPLIMGVDIARFGDDETVFWFRRGRVSLMPIRQRGVDTVVGVSHMLHLSREHKAQHIALDMGNTGSAWRDVAVNAMGATNVLGVHFGGTPKNPQRFLNKRAEMYYEACEWIKEGGAMPPIPEMVMGLSTMTYAYDLKGRIQIEEKAQIKARLGRSPDPEDAFACTFAFPAMVEAVTASGIPESLTAAIRQSHRRDYDPIDRFEREQRGIYGT